MICKKCKQKLKFKRIHYRWGYLFGLDYIQCSHCGIQYKIVSSGRMSYNYTDALFKILMVIFGITSIVMKSWMGVIVMIITLIILDFVINPMLIKTGFLRLDDLGGKK